MGVCCVDGRRQQGPFQFGSFLLSFAVLRPEHFTCNQFVHDVHCTLESLSFLLHTGQIQTSASPGPGFCSIPARKSSSQIRHAGVA